MTQAWNPAHSGSGIAFSNGNLTATKITSATDNMSFGVESVTTGKFYWEITINFSVNSQAAVGLGNTASGIGPDYLGDQASTLGWYGGGNVISANSSVGTYASFTSGSTVGIALDLINNKFWGRVGAAGNWNNDILANQNPATNTGGTAIPSAVFASAVVPGINLHNLTTPDNATAAFAQGSWIGTAPSGFSPFDNPPTTVSPGAGSISFNGFVPTIVNNVPPPTLVFPGTGVMTFRGFVPGIQGIVTLRGGAPDTDQSYVWLDTSGREDANRRRLREMREEIGLLPSKVSAPAVAKAEKQVRAAVAAVVKAAEYEAPDFDKIVGVYAKAYTAAFSTILKNMRHADIEGAFMYEIRALLTEEEKRRRRIREDDEAVMKLLSDLL